MSNDMLLILLGLIGSLCIFAGFFKKGSTKENQSHTLIESNVQLFLDEISKEYDQLIQTLKDNNQSVDRKLQLLNNRLKTVEEVVLHHHTDEDSEKVPANLSKMKSKYQQIVEMSKLGLSPSEIAKKLGMGSGEVEFISELLKQGETA